MIKRHFFNDFFRLQPSGTSADWSHPVNLDETADGKVDRLVHLSKLGVDQTERGFRNHTKGGINAQVTCTHDPNLHNHI